MNSALAQLLRPLAHQTVEHFLQSLPPPASRLHSTSPAIPEPRSFWKPALAWFLQSLVPGSPHFTAPEDFDSSYVLTVDAGGCLPGTQRWTHHLHEAIEV